MTLLVFLFTPTPAKTSGCLLVETLLVKWCCEQPRATSDQFSENREWQKLPMIKENHGMVLVNSKANLVQRNHLGSAYPLNTHFPDTVSQRLFLSVDAGSSRIHASGAVGMKSSSWLFSLWQNFLLSHLLHGSWSQSLPMLQYVTSVQPWMPRGQYSCSS